MTLLSREGSPAGLGRLHRPQSIAYLAWGAVTALTLGAALPAAAQTFATSDPLMDYARLRQLTGAAEVRSVGVRGATAADVLAGTGNGADPWRMWIEARRAPAVDGISLAPVGLLAGANSARPWGVNDGALWQGKGANASATAGLALAWGRFSAEARPVAVWSQNADFALSPYAVPPGLSPYAYPTTTFQRIDLPQRFGDEAVGRVDAGHSFVRARVGPVALGLSNEQRWWGAGRRNGIILSDHAPGFGHAFLATDRPAETRFGTLEATWLWGRLRESSFFDARRDNDLRFITGAAFSFRPKLAPALELGATRMFVQDWDAGGPGGRDLLLVFVPLEKRAAITPENPTGDDERDQLASVFARWVFPEAGLELYGEWARGDHSRDTRDLLTEPEHASAWQLGLQKVLRADSAAIWRLAAELTLLGAGRTSQVRAPPSAFYEHHLVPQGYTHRGQVLGAGIGPGGSQLYVALDRFAPWGKLSFGALRTVYDNDRFYALERLYYQHEVEPSFFAEALLFRGAWEWSGALTTSRLLNKHYIHRNDERNWNAVLGARWHPMRGR